MEIQGTIVDSCFIRNNQIGIMTFNFYSVVKNSVIESNDSIGILLSAIRDTVIKCNIKYNGIGIYDQAMGTLKTIITGCEIMYDSIGIKLDVISTDIFCNKICSNSAYNIMYDNPANSNCIADNYWCTNDSNSIAAQIYDGFDNISLGLLTFMPIDTFGCYLTIGIDNDESHKILYLIFPNPVSKILSIQLLENVFNPQVRISNLLGEFQLVLDVTNRNTEIDLSALSSGVYLIEVIFENRTSRKMFIKQ
jgi:hypothetical protein